MIFLLLNIIYSRESLRGKLNARGAKIEGEYSFCLNNDNLICDLTTENCISDIGAYLDGKDNIKAINILIVLITATHGCLDSILEFNTNKFDQSPTLFFDCSENVDVNVKLHGKIDTIESDKCNIIIHDDLPQHLGKIKLTRGANISRSDGKGVDFDSIDCSIPNFPKNVTSSNASISINIDKTPIVFTESGWDLGTLSFSEDNFPNIEFKYAELILSVKSGVTAVKKPKGGLSGKPNVINLKGNWKAVTSQEKIDISYLLPLTVITESWPYSVFDFVYPSVLQFDKYPREIDDELVLESKTNLTIGFGYHHLNESIFEEIQSGVIFNSKVTFKGESSLIGTYDPSGHELPFVLAPKHIFVEADSKAFFQEVKVDGLFELRGSASGFFTTNVRSNVRFLWKINQIPSLTYNTCIFDFVDELITTPFLNEVNSVQFVFDSKESINNKNIEEYSAFLKIGKNFTIADFSEHDDASNICKSWLEKLEFISKDPNFNSTGLDNIFIAMCTAEGNLQVKVNKSIEILDFDTDKTTTAEEEDKDDVVTSNIKEEDKDDVITSIIKEEDKDDAITSIIKEEDKDDVVTSTVHEEDKGDAVTSNMKEEETTTKMTTITTTDETVITPTKSPDDWPVDEGITATEKQSKGTEITITNKGFTDGTQNYESSNIEEVVFVILGDQKEVKLRVLKSGNEDEKTNEVYVKGGSKGTKIMISPPSSSSSSSIQKSKFGISPNSEAKTTVEIPILSEDEKKFEYELNFLSKEENEDKEGIISIVEEKQQQKQQKDSTLYKNKGNLEVINKITLNKGGLTIEVENWVNNLSISELVSYQTNRLKSKTIGIGTEEYVSIDIKEMKLKSGSDTKIQNSRVIEKIESEIGSTIEMEGKFSVENGKTIIIMKYKEENEKNRRIINFGKNTEINTIPKSINFVKSVKTLSEGKEVAAASTNIKNKVVEQEVICGEKFKKCEEWKEIYEKSENTIYSKAKCITKTTNGIEETCLVLNKGSEGEEDGAKGEEPKSKLGGGEIAGIVIGVLAFVAIVIGVVIYLKKKKDITSSSRQEENLTIDGDSL